MKSTSKLDNSKKAKKEKNVWPLPMGKKSSSKTIATEKESSGTRVSVTANADIGFGNYLYIRGDGCGLSWNRGVQMDPIASDSWYWECKCDCDRKYFEFKVLINDELWSVGENFVAIGEKNEIVPKF
jgi:hypothetical protein